MQSINPKGSVAEYLERQSADISRGYELTCSSHDKRRRLTKAINDDRSAGTNRRRGVAPLGNKPGDLICPKCGYVVFASKTKCCRCASEPLGLTAPMLGLHKCKAPDCEYAAHPYPSTQASPVFSCEKCEGRFN